MTYHGIVGGDKKRELLRMCDIFCLLTSYPNEGQPISILEAMGNGMVIVTADHAGIPDLVTDGVNGIVVKKETINPSAIYDQLLRIKEYRNIEALNRDTAKTRFNQNIYIANMESCFGRT